MRINHNIAALNTYRQLNSAATGQSKSMEKLSSGLRINKAGDDAAGLAISEKMRGQIRGLDMAAKNSQDSISLIQTAEGALNETHSILQRMRELAVQSSNDTNTADDREKIQSEVDELAKEITRISNTTEFNTQNLMAGGLDNTFHIGANEGQNIKFSIGAMDAQSLGVADSTKSATAFLAETTGITSATSPSRGLDAGDYKIQTTRTNSSAGTVSKDIQQGATTKSLAVTNADKYTGTQDKTYIVKVTGVSADAADNAVNEIQYSTDDGSTWTTVTAAMDGGTKIDGMTFAIADEDAGGTAKHVVGDQYSFKATAAKVEVQLTDDSDVKIGPAQTVRAGDTSAVIGNSTEGKTVEVKFDFDSLTDSTGATDAATFTVGETSSKKAEIVDGKVNTDAFVAAGINVSDQASASKAITKINDAITTVSEERSKMGAVQNRLEHTINNLNTSSENLTAAESRIRDVDYALAA
jgi:flagellin